MKIRYKLWEWSNAEKDHVNFSLVFFFFLSEWKSCMMLIYAQVINVSLQNSIQFAWIGYVGIDLWICVKICDVSFLAGLLESNTLSSHASASLSMKSLPHSSVLRITDSTYKDLAHSKGLYSITQSCFTCFPCGPTDKETACNAGDLGSTPGLGWSPGEGKGYPLQYSGLEIPWAV